MHWLENWRKAHKFSRQQLADAVECSEALIWILENMAGGITHPLIANDIANFTGATAKQRDSIVHKKHRGTWKPDPTRKPKPLPKPEKRERKEVCINTAPAAPILRKKPVNRGWKERRVLAVSADGVPSIVYDSVAETARVYDLDISSVVNRCKGRMKGNEFMLSNVTFRYEDTWNEDVAAEVRRKGEDARRQKAKGYFAFAGSWYLIVDSETIPLLDYCKKTGMQSSTMRLRMRKGLSLEEVIDPEDKRGKTRKNNARKE